MNLKTIKSLGAGALVSALTAGSALAQTTTDYTTHASGGSAIGGLVPLIFAILVIVSAWKVFTKAGQPGWASIIPIYNVYIVLKIVGRPWWWLLLLIIPFVGFVIGIPSLHRSCKKFPGRGAGFGVGLAFLGFIFFPILAFGDATYKGPSVS